MSRPAALRASCRTRTTSRATPARRSSGVISRSRATDSPDSEVTAHPCRGVSEMMRSSPASSIRSPPTSTVSRPSTGRPAAETAAAITGVRLPNRRPSVRKFGFTVTSTTSAAAASTVATLSSSAIWARRSAESPANSGAATTARASGWRVRTPLPARAARPSSTTRRTRSIRVASPASTRSGRGVGQSARWTESGASARTPAASFDHSVSVRNGMKGASSRVRPSRQV